MSDSITKIGFIFIVYLFVVILTYFVISAPVEMIFDSFDDSDFGDAEDEMDLYMGTYRSAFTIAMALFLSIPLTYLVTKIFSREPDYHRYRRF